MAFERFIRAQDGAKIFTQDMGTGKTTLVLCDGLGCSGFIWPYLEKSLGRKYRVIRWHYRGHGFSDIGPQGYGGLTLDNACGDLASILEAHGVKKAVLVGHSMGVQVILEYATRHPEQIEALVPICGSYGRPLDTFHNSSLANRVFPYVHSLFKRSHRLGLLAWKRILQSEVSYQLGSRLEIKGELIQDHAFRQYFKDLAIIDPLAFLSTLDSLRHHSVEHRLGDITAPTLILAASHDTFTPVWLSKRMQKLMPNAELLIVQNASHAMPIEHPDLVELRLEKFLNEKLQNRNLPAEKTTPKKKKNPKKKSIKKSASSKTTVSASQSRRLKS